MIDLILDFQKLEQELCRFWMDKAFPRYTDNSCGLNVIEDKKIGVLIGQSGLFVQKIDGNAWLEVGYFLLSNYYSKGYAIEAAGFARNYSF